MATMIDTVYGKDDVFSVAQGLYWYCADYHGGQNSEEYSIMSQLEYRPAPSERGPSDSIAQAVYDDLGQGQLDMGDVYDWIENHWFDAHI